MKDWVAGFLVVRLLVILIIFSFYVSYRELYYLYNEKVIFRKILFWQYFGM